VQQGQQNGNGLLFVPTEYDGQGQVIHAAIEGARKRHRDLDRAVGVIALADVEQARDAADIAEFQFIEAVFAAGQRHDHAIVRNAGGQVGVVVPAGLGAVAAANQEETADLAGLDRVDNRAGNIHHGIAPETDGDVLLRLVFGKPVRGEGRLDHGGKVAVRNMGDPRPMYQAAGENPGLITLAGLLDAVRGHEDGAREGIEFLGLVLPRAAIVAHEVLVLLKPRVGQAGEHFTVGVYIDPLALGLFQQFFQILKIMTGNQDALAFYGRRLGMSIGARIRRVKHFHDAQVRRARFERAADQGVHIAFLPGKEGERIVGEGVDVIVFDTQYHRVIGIGGHALQAVQDEFLQSRHIAAKLLKPVLN